MNTPIDTIDKLVGSLTDVHTLAAVTHSVAITDAIYAWGALLTEAKKQQNLQTFAIAMNSIAQWANVNADALGQCAHELIKQDNITHEPNSAQFCIPLKAMCMAFQQDEINTLMLWLNVTQLCALSIETPSEQLDANVKRINCRLAELRPTVPGNNGTGCEEGGGAAADEGISKNIRSILQHTTQRERERFVASPRPGESDVTLSQEWNLVCEFMSEWATVTGSVGDGNMATAGPQLIQRLMALVMTGGGTASFNPMRMLYVIGCISTSIMEHMQQEQSAAGVPQSAQDASLIESMKGICNFTTQQSHVMGALSGGGGGTATPTPPTGTVSAPPATAQGMFGGMDSANMGNMLGMLMNQYTSTGN
jgi:hypothetical protein